MSIIFGLPSDVTCKPAAAGSTPVSVHSGQIQKKLTKNCDRLSLKCQIYKWSSKSGKQCDNAWMESECIRPPHIKQENIFFVKKNQIQTTMQI